MTPAFSTTGTASERVRVNPPSPPRSRVSLTISGELDVLRPALELRCVRAVFWNIIVDSTGPRLRLLSSSWSGQLLATRQMISSGLIAYEKSPQFCTIREMTATHHNLHPQWVHGRNCCHILALNGTVQGLHCGQGEPTLHTMVLEVSDLCLAEKIPLTP
jgi:hypothetical protein